MVKNGQATAAPAEVVGVAYENRERPRAGVEVLSFTELRGRLRSRVRGGPSRPDFHQLLLVRAGHGTAVVDFVPYACGPGTLLHVRPGQVQRFPAAGDGRLAELDATLVLFTAESPPPLPPAATRLLDGEGYGPAARTLGGAAYAEIGAAVAELAAEYARTDHPLGVDLLRHLLAALLLRLARLPGDGLPAGEPAGEPAGGEVFRAFRRAVERGFAAGVPGRDVEGYAHRVGCSARTLTRACRAATGRSAKEYLDARVALEAKRLLAHTALPVAAVGRRLGFAEATNFGKFFRREAGVTPGAFRDEHGAAA